LGAAAPPKSAVRWNRRRVGSCGMSRPVIALAAFSLAAVFRSEAEDNQHGNHRKNQQVVIIGTVPALEQSLGCKQAQQHRSRCGRCRGHVEHPTCSHPEHDWKTPGGRSGSPRGPVLGFRLLLGRHDERDRGSGCKCGLTLTSPCRS
jgi:hypothetical protein